MVIYMIPDETLEAELEYMVELLNMYKLENRKLKAQIVEERAYFIANSPEAEICDPSDVDYEFAIRDLANEGLFDLPRKS